MSERKLDWWEYLSFVTPVFVTIAIFLVGDLRNQITRALKRHEHINRDASL